MATKTTGSLTVKSTSTIDTALDYSSDFTTKFTYTESSGAGANAFTIHSDTTAVALSLKGTSDDVLIINGYSGDYTAKLAGSKLTLTNNNQIITVALAAKSIVKLQFLDGSKDVNLVEKTLGGDSLITKTGVLHINGMNSHELTSVTTAVKAALTDVNKKSYATVDAAIISDNTLVISKALTDKSGKSYATVDAAITSNDAAITTQALTDTTVTPNVVYPNLNAAILSNDQAIISQSLTGTNFSTIASLISAYNKFALQSLTSFKVEALTPATMLPASAVSVSEGATAFFKISLTNRGTGDYSVKTMLTGTIATPDSDFVNSLTLDNASIAAGIRFNPITGILTIPASSQSISAILSTTIKNDMVSPEAGEKVNLAISDAQGASVASLGTTDIASVTILDVQPPTFSVTANTGPVLEGASTTFTVSLANHAVSDYSVNVKLNGTNAVQGSDFSALTLDPTTPATVKFDSVKGILTIPAAAATTSVKFNTTINTDNRVETGQSVTLSLSQDTTNSSNANTLITSTASSTTAVITDTTPAFSVTAGSTSVDKGKAASFTISLANASTGDYKVNLAATTLNSSILNTLALDSTNSNAGVTFDGSILTIPAATITAANKLPIKVVLTSLTNPFDNTSVSLALSNPTGTNAAISTALATIGINNVLATSLTSDIDSIITPDNSNTLILATSLTVNANATSFDSVKDNGINDNDVMNIITNSWPVSPAKTILIDKIETINLTALGTITVDNSTITGVNNFNIKNSTATVTLDKIASASTILGLEGSLVNNLTAKYKTAPKITDTLTVTLNNATNAIFTLDSTILLDKGFGFAELSVLNTSSLTSFDGKVSTLTISGVAPLTVGDTTATAGLIGVTNLELINNNVIKFGNIGTNGTATTYITTFKAPTNTGGITTGIIQGSTGGFTIQLGSGLDSISVQDNTTASTNINDIRLGAGNDSLTFTKSTNGKTYISGEDGNDTINVSGSASSASDLNTVDGGNGDDKITISVSGSYLINGGAGNDIITDSIGSNVIDGGDGNDTIYGGGGKNTITGGSGSDTLYVESNGTSTATDTHTTANAPNVAQIETITIDGAVNAGDVITISGLIAASGTSSDIVYKVTGNEGSVNGVATALVAALNTAFGASSGHAFATATSNGTLTITAGTAGTAIGTVSIALSPAQTTITDFTISSDKLTISSGAIAYVYASGVANYSNDVTNSGKLYIDGSQNYAGIPVTIAENITGSSGADSIKGGAGNDTITGGLGSDSITAGAGIDTITDFKVGEDTLTILSGATAKVYASTTATGTAQSVAYAFSNAGTLYIDGATTYNGLTVTGAESITGSAGADSIVGGAGSDSINGGAGNDTIVGGLGNDTITGGSSDTITVDAGTDTINNFTIGTDTLTINSGATAKVTFSGGSNVNYNPVSNLGILDITIAAGTSSVTGSIGADSITGSAGSDSIDGGSGNDTITGGLGSDSITASIGTDTITDFTIGADQLTINSGAIAHVYTSGSNSYVNVVTNNGTLYIDGITAGGTQSITGSTGRDSIVGGAYNDTITGGNGDDTISGGSGRNTINVDSGIDTITDFLLSYDTLNVSLGATARLYAFTITSGVNADYSISTTINSVTSYTIENSGKLYIDGSTTSDGTPITSAKNIIGSSGADIIVGGKGNDTIFGFFGNDTITSGDGNDFIQVGNLSTDTIITDFNPRSDTLNIAPNATAHVYASGTENDMRAVQNSGHLYIDGSTTTNSKSITGSNYLVNSIVGGSDSIVGGSGADTITGGTGIDTLTGGAGADTFVFGINDSPYIASDNVTDFTSGNDLIRFAGSVVFNERKSFENSQVVLSVDAYGFATFPSVSSYSQKVSLLQTKSITNAAQTVTLFVDGSDTYLFFAGSNKDISNADLPDLKTDDQIIKLTGVSGRFFDEMTKVNDTDITIS